MTRLKQLRERKKLTLRAVDEKVGIKHSRLWRMENRLEQLWKGDIERLSKAYYENVNELVDKKKLAIEAEKE